MSEYKNAYGCVIPVITPLNRASVKEINDIFDCGESKIFVNNEGTLIFSDVSSDEDIYGHMTILKTELVDEFCQKLYDIHIPVHTHNLLPYVSVYTDGLECPMREMTLEEYNKQIGE